MASVEVESAANTLPGKVESTSKEVEAVAATPPVADPVVEEPTEETIIEAPAAVEDPSTVEVKAPVEIETQVVEPPKSNVKEETTQEEVNEEDTPATTEAVSEETPATIKAIPEGTVATEEARESAEGDKKTI